MPRSQETMGPFAAVPRKIIQIVEDGELYQRQSAGACIMPVNNDNDDAKPAGGLPPFLSTVLSFPLSHPRPTSIDDRQATSIQFVPGPGLIYLFLIIVSDPFSTIIGASRPTCPKHSSSPLEPRHVKAVSLAPMPSARTQKLMKLAST